MLIPMPANNPRPELFEIEADSPESREPQNETYVIRMRLQGAYEVRSFLSDLGVDERRIAFAIEELGRTKQVKIRNRGRAA
jgi:hypothetical protein